MGFHCPFLQFMHSFCEAAKDGQTLLGYRETFVGTKKEELVEDDVRP